MPCMNEAHLKSQYVLVTLQIKDVGNWREAFNITFWAKKSKKSDFWFFLIKSRFFPTLFSSYPMNSPIFSISPKFSHSPSKNFLKYLFLGTRDVDDAESGVLCWNCPWRIFKEEEVNRRAGHWALNPCHQRECTAPIRRQWVDFEFLLFIFTLQIYCLLHGGAVLSWNFCVVRWDEVIKKEKTFSGNFWYLLKSYLCIYLR
jgi:hypothetical protein